MSKLAGTTELLLLCSGHSDVVHIFTYTLTFVVRDLLQRFCSSPRL